jgi:hypothetical protein
LRQACVGCQLRLLLMREDFASCDGANLLVSTLRPLERPLGSSAQESAMPCRRKGDAPYTLHNSTSFATTQLECHIRRGSGQDRCSNQL